jgi:hypothetical protein
MRSSSTSVAGQGAETLIHDLLKRNLHGDGTLSTVDSVLKESEDIRGDPHVKKIHEEFRECKKQPARQEDKLCECQKDIREDTRLWVCKGDSECMQEIRNTVEVKVSKETAEHWCTGLEGLKEELRKVPVHQSILKGAREGILNVAHVERGVYQSISKGGGMEYYLEDGSEAENA